MAQKALDSKKELDKDQILEIRNQIDKDVAELEKADTKDVVADKADIPSKTTPETASVIGTMEDSIAAQRFATVEDTAPVEVREETAEIGAIQTRQQMLEEQYKPEIEAVEKAMEEQPKSLEEMKSVHDGICQGVFDVLGVENSVRSRMSYGGTAPEQVRAQVARWKNLLGLD
jgi:hypothetical protein